MSSAQLQSPAEARAPSAVETAAEAATTVMSETEPGANSAAVAENTGSTSGATDSGDASVVGSNKNVGVAADPTANLSNTDQSVPRQQDASGAHGALQKEANSSATQQNQSQSTTQLQHQQNATGQHGSNTANHPQNQHQQNNQQQQQQVAPALSFAEALSSDAALVAALSADAAAGAIVIVEMYSRFAGPCAPIEALLRRLIQEAQDGPSAIKFLRAATDSVPLLGAKHMNRSCPTFTLWIRCALVGVVRGANAPLLEAVLTTFIALRKSSGVPQDICATAVAAAANNPSANLYYCLTKPCIDIPTVVQVQGVCHPDPASIQSSDTFSIAPFLRPKRPTSGVSNSSTGNQAFMQDEGVFGSNTQISKTQGETGSLKELVKNTSNTGINDKNNVSANTSDQGTKDAYEAKFVDPEPTDDICVLLLKPDAASSFHIASTLAEINANCVKILRMRRLWITDKETARTMFPAVPNDATFLDTLVSHLTSGPCVAFVLGKSENTATSAKPNSNFSPTSAHSDTDDDASTDASLPVLEKAREKPQLLDAVVGTTRSTVVAHLRAQFARDQIRNAVRASKSCADAHKEYALLFKTASASGVSEVAWIPPVALDSGVIPTLCVTLIAPDIPLSGVDDIIATALSRGLEVVKRARVCLSLDLVSEWMAMNTLDPNVADPKLQETVSYWSSAPGETEVVLLRGYDAAILWSEVLGPEDPDIAKKDWPKSLRARYGTQGCRNGVVASKSHDIAARHKSLFFVASRPVSRRTSEFNLYKLNAPKAVTLALIKPDVMPCLTEILTECIPRRGFAIRCAQTLTMSKETATEFYKDHIGKPFFEDLVSFITSGPTHALMLEHDTENVVTAWRDAIGPTDIEEAKITAPLSLRAKYGTSKTKNAFHGSDSAESAMREITLLFPAEAAALAAATAAAAAAVTASGQKDAAENQQPAATAPQAAESAKTKQQAQSSNAADEKQAGGSSKPSSAGGSRPGTGAKAKPGSRVASGTAAKKPVPATETKPGSRPASTTKSSAPTAATPAKKGATAAAPTGAKKPANAAAAKPGAKTAAK